MSKLDDTICPVCGYYCLGKGGHGCIDKPSMINPTPKPMGAVSKETIDKIVINNIPKDTEAKQELIDNV